MKKIKIAYILDNLVIGGVSRVVLNLCNNLDLNKFDIHLIVLSDQMNMLEIAELNPNIKVHNLNYEIEKSYSLISYLKNSFLISKTKQNNIGLFNLIVNLDLDILHFHTVPRKLVIGVIAKKYNSQLKLVYTDHSVRISKNQYKFHQIVLLSIAYQKLYKHYDIIAVSNQVSDSLQRYKIAKKQKISLLENCINTRVFKRDNSIKQEPHTFLYVTRLAQKKGIETLIAAWSKAKKPLDSILYIVGPDELNGKYHQLADKDKSILFPGKTKNISDFLNKASFGLFPSEKEGLPLALLEMMAYELPVIISDIPELKEIITDHLEGLQFIVNNEIDLISKIEFLISKPDLASKLGKNARLKAVSYYDKNNPIKFHETYYLKLLKT